MTVESRCATAAAVLVLFVAALQAAPAGETGSARLEAAHFARSLQPGEVVRIRVESADSLKLLNAHAFGKTFPLYQATATVWNGLIGIDLETPPGPYAVAIEGTDAAGAMVSVEHPLAIEDKQFPTRHLTVEQRFVSPPKSVLERIERERKRVDAILAEVNPRKLWVGSFLSPVPGSPTSSFGERSVFNQQPRSPHSGADFRARAGTPVKAPNAGRVALAASLYLPGNTVIIDHGLGLYSYLAHLSRFAVREGAMVKRGDVIGAVGATGRVTGPHLHWSVRLVGARVDPSSLMAAVEIRPENPRTRSR